MSPDSKTKFRQSMDDLPDELALKVLSYADQATLYHCILTSKRIYRISLPLLYRQVSHHMYSEPSKIQSAVRTLIKRPELASKVEIVALCDPVQNDNFWDIKSWTEWAKEKYNATLHEDDKELFVSAARKYLHLNASPSHDDVWTREETHAALLIALSTNLKLLHLENPTTKDEQPRFVLDHLVLSSLFPKIKEQAILQNLTTLHAVTARLEGGQGGFRLSSIAPFFHLPNLRRVVGMACFEPEDDLYQDFDCPAGTSNVTDLSFIRSSICPIGLSQMLSACKAVESFDCDWAGLSVGWVEINFPLLRSNLAMHKDTMKRLRLDTRKHYDSWPERDDGLVPPLGEELKTFTALKKLDAPASALIGWDEDDVGGYHRLRDVLPPNLEELKINEYAPRLVEELDDFIPHCAELYPKLKVLCISRSELEHEENGDAEERLLGISRDLAPALRVQFEDGSEVDHFEVMGSIGSASI
ncbi:uncharacterized protein PV09_03685 [Verruconis gallopava]|uniref:F-box domain-containing protein n=1 Tax=Verruconis gallopava TaxID=253628 RepID=A0A0D2ADQ8_9PEZI|nr:uncharacterized protein PV09_03685 [Verruconis gallopava]KIW05133.1 hypothetical protein PV09_03685 [Verruconis gallopava]